MVAAVLMAAMPAVAQAETTIVNNIVPVTMWVINPCTGDLVYFTGEAHEIIHVTKNENGYNVKYNYNPQGISGVSNDGSKYRITGITQFEYSANVGLQASYTSNFRLIGQGPDNNFVVRENWHITVSSDGTIKSYHDNFEIDCK